MTISGHCAGDALETLPTRTCSLTGPDRAIPVTPSRSCRRMVGEVLLIVSSRTTATRFAQHGMPSTRRATAAICRGTGRGGAWDGLSSCDRLAPGFGADLRYVAPPEAPAPGRTARERPRLRDLTADFPGIGIGDVPPHIIQFNNVILDDHGSTHTTAEPAGLSEAGLSGRPPASKWNHIQGLSSGDDEGVIELFPGPLPYLVNLAIADSCQGMFSTTEPAGRVAVRIENPTEVVVKRLS